MLYHENREIKYFHYVNVQFSWIQNKLQNYIIQNILGYYLSDGQFYRWTTVLKLSSL